MIRLNVFFSDQLLDEIDQQAKLEGINRSALIRAAVEKYIDLLLPRLMSGEIVI